MRSVLIVLLATTAIPAYAADMYPVKAAPPVAASITPPGWAGFYAGLDGGYGWGSNSIDPLATINGVAITLPFANPAPAGFLFGGHGGHNWQSGNWVSGLEVDYLTADMTDSQTLTALGGRVSTTLATKVDALASGRARIGYLVTPNVLLYGTGGAAWGHSNATLTSNIGANSVSNTAFANQFGWVAGAGAEMKVLNNILVRAQFLHYNFGDVAYMFPTGSGITLGANAKTTVNAATGGITYLFNTN